MLFNSLARTGLASAGLHGTRFCSGCVVVAEGHGWCLGYHISTVENRFKYIHLPTLLLLIIHIEQDMMEP